MRNPKGVLFDLDGTLLDTAEDLGSALNHVLTLKGFPTLPKEQYKNTASHGSKGLIELGFGQGLVDYDFEELRKEFLRFYHENISIHTSQYEGVEQTLAKLDKYHIPWGIVTNKPEALAVRLLTYFPNMKTSKVMIGGDTFKQRKPDPFPLIHAASILNVTPEDCIYLGDAQRDIQAANAANMFSILANYGYIEETDNVEDWESNMAIERFQDLLLLFDWNT
jgi:phosphoglycolate phosphatase